MLIKFAPKVKPTINQFKEIAESICSKPDKGWNYDSEKDIHHHKMDLILHGEEGIYYYRVNTSWEMITIINIK